MHDVTKVDRPLAYFQPNHGRSSIAKIAGNLPLRKAKACSGIFPWDTSQPGFLSLGSQLLFSTEAVVGFLSPNQFNCLGLVGPDPITLPIGSKVASQVWAFLPLQPQPAKIIKNEALETFF